MDFRTKQGQHVPRAQPGNMMDWRFWFDRNVGKWMISRADGKGLILTVDRLQTCELDTTCHPNGTQTCTAELLADGATFRMDSSSVLSARTATLRLLRSFDQVVHVPIVAQARPKALSPK